MDLLAGVIPPITSKYPQVQFIIGGDGPKRILLEEVRERCQLLDRVQMLGSLQHSKIRDVLVQGDILLNTSLTEAFCIAIVEGACCGLQVVSTKVGGIPEVLPAKLIYLAEPNVQALTEELEKAIEDRIHGRNLDPFEMHASIQAFYSWRDVALRTETVYHMVMSTPLPDTASRLLKYNQCGAVSGKLFMMIAAFNIILLFIIQLLWPTENIDKATCVQVRRSVMAGCRLPAETVRDPLAARRASRHI
uniref:Glycosyl transferase family 1 domain-containing protein n=1 Tax=Arion vulgaris TaxID=1028688 RepID=A0A0B7A566_9EUPU